MCLQDLGQAGMGTAGCLCVGLRIQNSLCGVQVIELWGAQKNEEVAEAAEKLVEAELDLEGKTLAEGRRP